MFYETDLLFLPYVENFIMNLKNIIGIFILLYRYRDNPRYSVGFYVTTITSSTNNEEYSG